MKAIPLAKFHAAAFHFDDEHDVMGLSAKQLIAKFRASGAHEASMPPK